MAVEKKQVKFESRVKETHYEYDTSESRKKKFRLFNFGSRKGRKGNKKATKTHPLDEGGMFVLVD